MKIGSKLGSGAKLHFRITVLKQVHTLYNYWITSFMVLQSFLFSI